MSDRKPKFGVNLFEKALIIGVVGYSRQKFDEELAVEKLNKLFDSIVVKYGHIYDSFVVVSGLTNMGIPKFAYEIATERGFPTVGIASMKARSESLISQWFPVDLIIMHGENWSDESETFLSNIDVLVRVGGGTQSTEEIAIAREMGIDIFEEDLASLSIPQS